MTKPEPRCEAESASSRTGITESNMSLSGGANRSGRKGATRLLGFGGVKDIIEQQGIFSISSPPL